MFWSRTFFALPSLTPGDLVDIIRFMHDTTNGPASGRFVLRIEPGLHAALRAAAEEAELSLNEYCRRKLMAPGFQVSGPATEVVGSAIAVVGDALLGVVAFGSWARGEQTARSDVDVLLIVSADVAIRRELYRVWDAKPVFWGRHPVEPHFVHVPDPGARISGLWAEVAVDGVVLFERGLEVSRLLAALRRRIAEGRVVRRRIHGQPYWVEAA
jgi:predicted nucleotidyltransferase